MIENILKRDFIFLKKKSSINLDDTIFFLKDQNFLFGILNFK